MQVQGLENMRGKHDSKQRRLITACKEIHIHRLILVLTVFLHLHYTQKTTDSPKTELVKYGPFLYSLNSHVHLYPDLEPT